MWARFWTILLILCMSLSACGRKSKEALLSEGVKELELGNTSSAVVLFKSALENDENFLEARFQLAKSYLALGKFDQAEKELEKVSRLNPARDEVTIELAKVYNMTNRGKQALDLASQYLSKHPDSVEGLETLGIAHAVLGRFDEAERYLQKALAADPKRVKTELELANVYVRSGNTAKAKQLLENLIKKTPNDVRPFHMLAAMESKGGNKERALEVYQMSVASNPSDVQGLYKIGRIYLTNRDLQRAEESAENLIKKFPKNPEGYKLKGLTYYQRKQYAEAISSLQTSIKLAPALEAYYFLGLCQYAIGELENSLSQFRVVLDQSPDFRQARIMLANVLLTQKRTDDAINELKRVLRNNENDAIARDLLGSAYMSKGMFAEGMQELNRATDIDPKMVGVYLKKSNFYFTHGRKELGESELVTAVKVSPNVVDNRMLLASYYLKVGDSSKALTVLQEGLTGKKGDVVLYNGIAGVQFARNNPSDALKALQKAKEVDSPFPASYQNSAIYYLSAGNISKAIEEYNALLRVDPNNLQALVRLASLYDSRGSEREAMALYDRAASTKNPSGFFAKAGYLYKKGRAAKAIKVLDELLKSDPNNLAALEMKGRILMSNKKYKKAIKVFEKVESISPDTGVLRKIEVYLAMKDMSSAVSEAKTLISKYPGSAKGYMVLASVYENSGDRNRAVSEIVNGLKIDPSNYQALLKLGNLYETLGEYKDAMAMYVEAERKKNDFASAIFAQGALLDKQGYKKEAIAKYQATLQKSRNHVLALNNLSYLYSSGYGSAQEALRLAVSAYKVSPGSPGVMDTLGLALLKNKRLDEAEKFLDKALGLAPNNPTMAYHLALVYVDKGDKNKALGLLQRALSHGDFPDAGAAKALDTSLRK